jgi:hypothetical protein
MTDAPWRSWLALRVSQRTALLLLVLLGGAVSFDREAAEAETDAFVRDTLQGWCQVHGKRGDLQVVVISVRFRAEPPNFAQGEGVVVAPVALDLPGAQRVLGVATRPPSLRKLTTQGITAMAWEYAGRVHRDMRFTGVALVERPAAARPALPTRPTFATLPPDLHTEATARAGDLEEHALDKCAAFPDWARRTAGDPPHTEQILRLARGVARRADERNREAEDICAALRQGRFTPHWAQVAVVMAAREVGIPAFGLASASARQIHLVGTYTDQAGWIVLDIERPEDGWSSGGPALVTKAPLLGRFAASGHDFWLPQGGAYANTGWGLSPLSSTEWRGRLDSTGHPTDTTEARSLRLSEACP